MSWPANKKVVVASIGIGLLAAVAALLLPEPSSWTGSWVDFHIPLAVLTLLTALDFGAATLFLLSLHVYKADLRKAYQGIVLGMVLIAIGSLQLPIVNGFDLWTSPWVRFGGIGLPFIISCLVLYVGTRILARLVGVKTVLSNVGLVVAIALFGAIAIVFVPHAPTDTKEIAFDLSNAISLFNILFNSIDVLIIYKITRRIGGHYTQAMNWLLFAILSGTLAPTFVVAHSLLTGAKSLGAPDTLLIFLVHGVITLTAGYMFAKAKEY